MPTIKTYDEHAAILITNQSKSINGNDSGNLMASTLGVVPFVAKSSNYTATENDEVIAAASSCATVTLPAVASTRLGKVYTIIHNRGTGAGTAVAVTANAAENINIGNVSVNSIPLARDGDRITVVNRQNQWHVTASKGIHEGIIFEQTSAVTVASSTSEVTLVDTGFGGNSTLPANFYAAYTVLRIRGRGYVSNTATPTLTLKVKHGSTVIASTGAITTASGLSNTGWSLEATIVCRSSGGSGTVMAQGEARINSTFYPMVNTATVTIDTTATQTASITAQWGTNSASNTITCQELITEVRR